MPLQNPGPALVCWLPRCTLAPFFQATDWECLCVHLCVCLRVYWRIQSMECTGKPVYMCASVHQRLKLCVFHVFWSDYAVNVCAEGTDCRWVQCMWEANVFTSVLHVTARGRETDGYSMSGCVQEYSADDPLQPPPSPTLHRFNPVAPLKPIHPAQASTLPHSGPYTVFSPRLACLSSPGTRFQNGCNWSVTNYVFIYGWMRAK